jgi:fatty acid desaturase
MSGSLWATYNIVINHIFEGVNTYTVLSNKSFAEIQVSSSCNHSSGSILGTYLTGGLNHQIEHHLFPSLAIHHYPLISKDIERICKKHKIKYNTKNILSLISSMHSTLKLYGNCENNAALPNLGDYDSLMDN